MSGAFGRAKQEQLAKALRECRDRARLLHGVADALAEEIDVTALGSRVVDGIVDALEAAGGFLLRVGSGEQPEVAYTRGSTVDGLLRELPLDADLLARVAAGPALIVGAREGTGPLLLVRAQHAGQVFGVLGLAGKRDGSRFTPEDVRLVQSLGTQLAGALHTTRLAREVKEVEAIRRELELARQLQRSLLPLAGPRIEGIEIVATCEPAGHLGGDYFDFFSFGNRQVGIVIADVCGHGIGAAMLMAAFRAMLHGESQPGFRPGAVLERVNERLVGDLGDTGMFVSAVLVSYEVGRNELLYANAGHPPPLLLGPDGSDIQKLEAGGPLLGLFPGARYDEGWARLAPGTVLVLYTDGLTEARGPDGDMFREERLARMLLRGHTLTTAELHARILRKVNRHVGGQHLQDDTTLIVTARSG